MKHRQALTIILFLVCLSVASLSVQAQSTEAAETKDDDTNLETQLYIILGTNQEGAESKIPSLLDPVVKQVRATLPFKNYRLAATLVNRVKNEGNLELTWVSGPFTSVIDRGQPTTRSQLRIRQIKLARTNEGQSIVQVVGFYFGASIPLPAPGAVAANNPSPPVFNYEVANLSTGISMREGEPVIVGTLNVGPSGDAIILVLAAKRTTK